VVNRAPARVPSTTEDIALLDQALPHPPDQILGDPIVWVPRSSQLQGAP
jgi:hypothetical protein